MSVCSNINVKTKKKQLSHIRKNVYCILNILCVFTDRVGGRTVTLEMNGALGKDVWDLGGQWVGR